jgi:hypothetical protein
MQGWWVWRWAGAVALARDSPPCRAKARVEDGAPTLWGVRFREGMTNVWVGTGVCGNPHLRSEMWGTRVSKLGAGVQVVLYAVVDVLGGAVFHLEVWMGLGGSLAVEGEPGQAAVDVVEVAVFGVGVEGEEAVEVVEGGVVGGGGIVAERGGVVEGGPGGGVDARAGDDDGRGGGGGGEGVAFVAAMAKDVEDEEAEDDGEQDVVAGTKVHAGLGVLRGGILRARAAAGRRCGP